MHRTIQSYIETYRHLQTYAYTQRDIEPGRIAADHPARCLYTPYKADLSFKDVT